MSKHDNRKESDEHFAIYQQHADDISAITSVIITLQKIEWSDWSNKVQLNC